MERASQFNLKSPRIQCQQLSAITHILRSVSLLNVIRDSVRVTRKKPIQIVVCRIGRKRIERSVLLLLLIQRTIIIIVIINTTIKK